MNGFSQEDIFNNVNFEDIFRGFGFGGGSSGGSSGGGFESIFDLFGFGGGRRNGPRQGDDIAYDLTITLEEAAQALKEILKYPTKRPAPTVTVQRQNLEVTSKPVTYVVEVDRFAM